MLDPEKIFKDIFLNNVLGLDNFFQGDYGAITKGRIWYCFVYEKVLHKIYI